MARDFVRLTSIVITVALLMTTTVGPACAGRAIGEQNRVSGVLSDGGERSGDAACLVLAGGTALLAAIICIREVRRMLS